MVNALLRNLDVLARSQIYEWKSFLAYRAQALLAVSESLVNMVLSFVFISIIYGVSQGIAGWSYYQLLSLVALMGAASSAVWYVMHPDSIMDTLRSGFFDTYLTKPYGPVFYLLARQANPYSFFYGAWYLLLFAYAASHAQFSLSAAVLFVVLVVLGLAALCAVVLFLEVASYRLFTRARWLSRLLDFASNAGQYPLGIFGGIGVFALTILVPVGLAAFYPASVLFHGSSATGVLQLAALDIVIAAAFYAASRRLLKGYTSSMG